MLLEVQNKKALSDLIFSIFLQKFYFIRTKTGKPVNYTKSMINALKDQQSYLMGHVNFDHSLLVLFKYLLYGSGTISSLYKIWALWGEKDLNNALAYIKDFVINWNVNDGCELWLKKHSTDTTADFTDFKDLIDHMN